MTIAYHHSDILLLFQINLNKKEIPKNPDFLAIIFIIFHVSTGNMI